MVALSGTIRGAERSGLSYPDLLDFEKNSTLFDHSLSIKSQGTTLSAGTATSARSEELFPRNYFDALGVQPISARFRPEEGTGRNAHRHSHKLHDVENRYKGDPTSLAKRQYMKRRLAHIIGLAPEKFHAVHRLFVQLLGADVNAGDIR